MAIKYSIKSSLIDALPKKLKDYVVAKVFKENKTPDLETDETEKFDKKNTTNILNRFLIRYVFFFDIIAFSLFFIFLPLSAIITQ